MMKKFKRGFYCLDYGNCQSIYYWDGKTHLEKFNAVRDCWFPHPANNIEMLEVLSGCLEFEILYLGE